MTNFTKKRLYVDEQAIDRDLQAYEARRNYFQSIVSAFPVLGKEIIPIGNDLEAITNTPKEYFTEKLIENGNNEIGGIPMDKAKVFDILHKPAGVSELVAKLLNDKDKNSLAVFEGNDVWTYHRWAQFFEIINMEVVITEATIEEITNTHTYYLETEKQNLANNVLDKLVTQLNELEALKSGSVEKIFSEYIEQNPHSRVVTKKPLAAKSFI